MTRISLFNTLGSGASTYSPVDLISNLRLPLYIAHRGGALSYPEQSIEAYRAAAAAGFAIEMDVQALSDGTLVNLHDSTVDRTMTGTGAVSSLTRAQWEAMSVKQTAGPGTSTNWVSANKGRPTYFLDVLDEFGGKVPIVAEAKIDGVAAAMITAVQDRNLQNSVIIATFTYSVAQTVAAAGIPAMYVSDTVSTGGSNPTFAQVFASGIQWLACSTSASGSYISNAKAAGLKVIVATVNTRAQRITSITTNGADGIFTDDPWYVSGHSDKWLAQDSDPWASKRFWAGARATSASGVVFYGEAMMGSNASAPTIHYVNHNWAGVRPSPGHMRIRTRVHFLPSSNTDTTRWISLFIGQFGDDASYLDSGSPQSPVQYGYHLLIRRNGTLEVWKRDSAGTATQLAVSGAGTPIAYGVEGFWDLEIYVTGTSVSMYNSTSQLAVSANDTTYREAFKLATVINGTHAYLSRMSVSDIP